MISSKGIFRVSKRMIFKVSNSSDDLKKNSGIQKFFTGIENGAKTCFQTLNTILRKCLKIVFSVLSVVGLLAGTFLFILVFWCLLYPGYFSRYWKH